jgi:hypothetical protein
LGASSKLKLFRLHANVKRAQNHAIIYDGADFGSMPIRG